MLTMLALAAGNIVMVVGLDEAGVRTGSWTPAGLFAFSGTVMLFVIGDAITRFVADIGFMWLYPTVLCCIGICAAALLREKIFAIKIWLALNCVAAASLWCLAVADKVGLLPF